MRVLSWDVGLRTLSYCILDVNWDNDIQQPIISILRWDIIDVKAEFVFPSHVKPQTGKNKDKLTLEQNVLAVLQALERRSDLMDLDLDAITIEQQPAGGQNRFSNVNMKVISCIIQSFFVMHMGEDFMVTFVSPSSKLVELRAIEKEERKNAVNNDDLTAEQSMRKRYKRNKSFAVEKSRELLENDESALAILASAGRKKDDLCDAFLLGYYYCLKHVKPKARKKRKAIASPPPIPDSKRLVIDSTQESKHQERKSLASFFNPAN